MPKVETVQVKSDAHPSGYITVNKSDAQDYKEQKDQKPAVRRNSSVDK